jgi:hypothetical protein
MMSAITTTISTTAAIAAMIQPHGVELLLDDVVAGGTVVVGPNVTGGEVTGGAVTGGDVTGSGVGGGTVAIVVGDSGVVAGSVVCALAVAVASKKSANIESKSTARHRARREVTIGR